MTLSLAARCAETGQLGAVISSSSICVASRCARVRAGVGAALSQNVTDPRLGPCMLDLAAGGADAPHALAAAVASTPHAGHRQLALIDAHGRSASYTGAQALATHSEAHGHDCVAIGNLLASEGVAAAMVAAFETTSGLLAQRLLAALAAGLAAGGELGPVHSAGLLVAGKVPWPIIDLRVDWSEQPLADLERLWQRYQPQLAEYVERALDPERAPAYGVPGNP